MAFHRPREMRERAIGGGAESASSVEVPAVFLVFKKIDRRAWDTIALVADPSKLDLI
jgi:hypothetical protein